MEKDDEDYIKKEGVEEKDRDDCARILTRDDRPDFVKVEIIGIESREEGGQCAVEIGRSGYLEVDENRN